MNLNLIKLLTINIWFNALRETPLFLQSNDNKEKFLHNGEIGYNFKVGVFIQVLVTTFKYEDKESFDCIKSA